MFALKIALGEAPGSKSRSKQVRLGSECEIVLYLGMLTPLLESIVVAIQRLCASWVLWLLGTPTTETSAPKRRGKRV